MRAKRVDIVSLRLVKECSVLYQNRRIASPEDAVGILKDFIEDCDREQFIVITVNTKNEPTSISTVSLGTLNTSLVHPREVFKVALLANGASIILAHNHPSGDPTPSREDLEITKKLVEIGQLMGIEVLDHIIIGADRFISLKQKKIGGL